MKSPEKMTNEQLMKWGLKTGRSISSQAYRSGMNSNRTLDLIDRYTELKDEMVKRGIWQAYCNYNGFDTGHDSYDCAA